MFDRTACKPPAPTQEFREAVAAQHGRVLAPGDRCVAYGEDRHGMQRGDYGTVIAGPYVPASERLFGLRETDAFLAAYDVEFDAGDVTDVSALLLVGHVEFVSAWHVFNPQGSITAGGPGFSRERIAQIAESRADGSTYGQIGREGDPLR